MSDITPTHHNIPRGVIYAQVDQTFGVQDYAPGLSCVRLIGVGPDDFRRNAYNSDAGCSIFLVDIATDLAASLLRVGPLGQSSQILQNLLRQMDKAIWPDGLWLKLNYRISTKETGAYAYELFANGDAPTNIKPLSISLQFGPPVVANFPMSEMLSVYGKSSFELHSFKVGQGMCALLHNEVSGVLFDLGAGTPIKRPWYKKGVQSTGKAMVNDLVKMTSGKSSLQAVISHLDSDHWRLLDWDPGLASSIKAIFIPDGLSSTTLPFKSKRLKHKVQKLGNHTVSHCGKPLFETHRSAPAHRDSNGECLVVEVVLNGKNLLPGDYVYSRMLTDRNTKINALASATFNSVVVPHHGDKESAVVSVLPSTHHESKAFFSAGNNKACKHPRRVSLDAHTAAGFMNIWAHSPPDIEDVLAVQLA